MSDLVNKFIFLKLKEDKSRFIKNNDTLTDEQKDEMIEFYKKHPNLESEGIDWQKDWTYSDFKKIKSKYCINTDGLKLKKDYLYYGNHNGLEYYVPLSSSAATQLAGKFGHRWCITADLYKWYEYTDELNSYFLFIFKGTDPICVEYGEDYINFWNNQNNTYGYDYSLLNKRELDFTKPSITYSPCANDDENIAIADNLKYGNKLDFDVLSQVNNDTRKILRAIHKNNK